jgi:hypothetical protein
MSWEGAESHATPRKCLLMTTPRGEEMQLAAERTNALPIRKRGGTSLYTSIPAEGKNLWIISYNLRNAESAFRFRDIGFLSNYLITT